MGTERPASPALTGTGMSDDDAALARSAAAALAQQASLAARLPTGADTTPQALLQTLSALAPLQDEGYRHWPAPIEGALAELCAGSGDGPSATPQLHLLLLNLVASLPARLSASGLPRPVQHEYLDVAARIVDQASRDHRYTGAGDDLFRKDLALLCLRLLPCRSHVVCRSGLPRRTLLRRHNLLGGNSLRVAWALSGRLGPLLENHVHPLMLDHFNAEGRQRCYQLVACLLQQAPYLGGLFGTSWYYDPSVGAISPRLAYLQQEPARFGALFIDAASNDDTVHDALQRSAARRLAFEQGRYRPRNVTMVWPRTRLLQAAARDTNPGD